MTHGMICVRVQNRACGSNGNAVCHKYMWSCTPGSPCCPGPVGFSTRISRQKRRCQTCCVSWNMPPQGQLATTRVPYAAAGKSRPGMTTVHQQTILLARRRCWRPGRIAGCTRPAARPSCGSICLTYRQRRGSPMPRCSTSRSSAAPGAPPRRISARRCARQLLELSLAGGHAANGMLAGKRSRAPAAFVRSVAHVRRQLSPAWGS